MISLPSGTQVWLAWLSETLAMLSAKSPLAQAIRALVLGRRNNYLFAGSDAGGETAARLYSLVGTCRLNGLDPHLYLRHVLERIAASA